jgi:hypothetical protein
LLKISAKICVLRSLSEPEHPTIPTVAPLVLLEMTAGTQDLTIEQAHVGSMATMVKLKIALAAADLAPVLGA